MARNLKREKKETRPFITVKEMHNAQFDIKSSSQRIGANLRLLSIDGAR